MSLWLDFPCREVVLSFARLPHGGRLPGEQCTGPSQGPRPLSPPRCLPRVLSLPSAAVTAGRSCPPAPARPFQLSAR